MRLAPRRYQGEQNANCGGPTQTAGAVYSTMLQTMVKDWREKFEQPDLLFGKYVTYSHA